MSRVIITNHIKLIITLQLALFTIWGGTAQICTDEDMGNNWNNSWISCQTSANPNPARSKSHWLLYEFDQPQSIRLSHIWNANRKGESAIGIKEAIIDYSVDGVNWTSLGTFPFPKANEKNSYQGFEGPDFAGVFVSKILITVVQTYGDGQCASLAEMQFNVNPDACYGEVDACGTCNGEGPNTWFADQDGDGLGNPGVSLQRCEQPVGFVSNADDDCDTGVIGWATVGKIFEENGCTGCHGAGAAGGLNLTTYNTTVLGGNKCGVGILTGTTLTDIITTDMYSGCGDPFIGPSMNDRVGGQIDEAELAAISKWIQDGAPLDCSCPPEVPDTDGDGFCDAVDRCPDIDNTLIGTPCDDGSDCTVEDVWQEDCNCRGQLIDRDGDGVCDTEDLAPDNPCTADGVVDGVEPEDWVAHPDNDCDLDKISVASGDLDDFSACIDKVGTLMTPECNCTGNLVDAGGVLIDFVGMSRNEAQAASGQPDGLFTGNISNNNDTLILQFPFMEVGEEICLTVGFSSGNGELRVFLNNRLMTFNGNRDLNNYQPQEFCFQAFNAGIQTLLITEDGPGEARIDGSTYSSCPCSGADITEVACLANFSDIGWRELDNCTLEICEGQPLILGTDRYETIKYQWKGPKNLTLESSTLSFEAVKPSDSGIYWIYYQNSSGCDLIKMIELNVLPAPPVTARVSPPSCGLQNGAIVLNFEDYPNRANLEFSIDGADGNYIEVADNLGRYIYSNLPEGIYDVWVRWSEGDCPVNLGIFDMKDQPGPELEMGPNQEVCEGETIFLSADAPGNTLTYQWSNDSKSKNQRLVPVLDSYADQLFNYRVSVTDENGCTSKGRIRVTVHSKPQALVDLKHPAQGAANGSITFNFADHPNHKHMEISIDGENGEYQKVADKIGSYTFTDLPEGNYSAWIRWEDGTCPVELGKIKLTPDDSCPEIKSTISQQSICEGESIRLEVTRGSGWNYAWSNGAIAATQVLTPTLRGYADETIKYSVTVTDKNGCSRATTEEVKVYSLPQAEVVSSNPHCGQADGTITFRFKDHPDQKKMEFSINGKNGTYKRVNDKNGSFTFGRLKKGRYKAWVRWGNDSCPVNLGRIDLKDEPGPQIDAGPDLVVCEGQAIRLKVNRGKGWSYRWSNGVKKDRQNIKLTPRPYADRTAKYTVTVTDKYGCKATDEVKVTALSAPRAKTTVSHPFCGRADGSITFRFKNHKQQQKIEFSITGKNGKYKTVKDNSKSYTFKKLKAGKYDAWVRWGNNSCPVRIGRIKLEDRPGPQIDAGPNLEVCDGQVVRLRVKKNSRWKYAWNNGVKKPSQTISLRARSNENRVKTYQVRVTDQNGCRATDEVKVTVLSKPRAKATIVNPSCGEANGSITFRFKDHKDQKKMEFSIDGKNGKFIRRRDDIGTYTFKKLPPGNYDLWVRWPGGKCPVRVERVKLRNQGNCPASDLIAPADEHLLEQTITGNDMEEEIRLDTRDEGVDSISKPFRRSGSEDRAAGLQVYPNPAAAGSSITIKYFAEEAGRPLKIMAPTGQLIREIDPDLILQGWNELTVELDYLSTGSYFVMDGRGNYEMFVIIE